MCRHCLDDVGDRDDASSDDDLLIRKAGRVTGTVESFMVLADHVGDGPGKFDSGEHVVTGLRMRLDDLHFWLGETPGAPENLSGNCHLAGVMDACGQADAFDGELVVD